MIKESVQRLMVFAGSLAVAACTVPTNDDDEVGTAHEAYGEDACLDVAAAQQVALPSCGPKTISSPSATYGTSTCGSYVAEFTQASAKYVRFTASTFDTPTTEAACHSSAGVRAWQRIIPPGGGAPYWNALYSGNWYTVWDGTRCNWVQNWPWPPAHFWGNQGNPYVSKIRVAISARTYIGNGKYEQKRAKITAIQGVCVD
jgi:hypothetical protein